MIPVEAIDDYLASLADGAAVVSRPRPVPVPRADDPVERLAARIGVSPRVAALRPDLAGRFEVVPAGEHFDRFLRRYCRHHRLVPGGPAPGEPFGLLDFQREFFDELLAVDEDGERRYATGVLLVGRKNGKTSLAAALALYMCSPADGEETPEVVLSAGSLRQVGKLWRTARAFIEHPRYGSPELREMFEPLDVEIRCPEMSGLISRIASDGDNNHSFDASLIIADELHTWKTPKQRENWTALNSGGGGRRDPLVVAISTEGEGNENELARLLDRIENSPNTEKEIVSPFLTIYRDTLGGGLAYRYAVPASTTLDDVDDFVEANPAPWRNRKRLAKELARTDLDAPSKLRLYGNRRAMHRDRWISDEMWEAVTGRARVPKGAVVATGVDAARTRDTTALAWAWKREDGVIVLNCRVWAAREDAAAHERAVGGRLDNDLVRDHLRRVVMRDHAAQLLFYDERYFDTQASDLSKDGMTVVEMHQGKPEMQAAWDEFYDAVYHGQVEVLDDPVLLEHVRSAVATKTERGWRVSKIKSDRSIDALAALVMAHYGCKHFTDFRRKKAVLVSW